MYFTLFTQQNYIAKLHTYFNALIQNIWLKTKNIESTERWKASFPKETVANAELHKAALSKTMITQE